MNQLYENALAFISNVFEALSNKFGNPELQPMGDGYVYRFREKSIYQAIIQKLVRVITGLKAISLLNEAGLLQEQAALQRTLDEFEEDIYFLCTGIIFNEIGELHNEYLAYFYEEEFDVPDSAIKSTQKRPMVSRKKIRAFNSKDRGAGYDQCSTIEISRTINKSYSGYVHGASPHLMELYYGNPPRFHLSGGIDSPLYEDHVGDLLNYYYRAILSFAFAAKAFGEDELFMKIRYFSLEFAKISGREDQLREPQKT
jgi:hypothetical protein